MSTAVHSLLTTMASRRQTTFAIALLVIFTFLHPTPTWAAVADNPANTVDPHTSSGTKPEEAHTEPQRDTSSDDWGSFYDPKNVFCGQYDCYKILGFDYFSWGDDPPSLKDITKSYRSLSRQWHPDKNKGKGAREKFVAIAKAYEILTNSDKRKEYDHFRDRPDEYFRKYGSGVLWQYAPKSDATFIIIIILAVGSAFTYYAQKSKWQRIADHLIKAAVEDLSPREGGSAESIEIREQALEILAEMKKESVTTEQSDNGVNTTKNLKTGEKKKKEKASKVSSKEKKEKNKEELRPIIVKLVNEIHDFGAGFHKPTLQDLLIVRMVKWPYHLTKSAVWWSKYALRRLKNLELNDEERETLTINAVGEVAWVAASEEDRCNMLKMDLWITENLVSWKEEQELHQLGLSANRKKQIKKLKKRGVSLIEEDDKMD
ncbi:hypothetical protein HJC23_013379 [Cyclotella cryptica]|uniref:J domain-containing protein n=1 Tax=Cyclotella cryptica TaxID=29204 RepID=A0ABD3Q1C8_9STRA|eukprot:CCRYP_010936-RA/>CCRYP_010936-RA protein AED:0.02 eAED:0.02 QI:143/1/1/1/1/1/3/92/430